MRKHQVSITAVAELDLVEIVKYIASDNPTAALKLYEKIYENILRLEDFPLIGVIPKNHRLERRGYRVLTVDNYLVFYVLSEDEIVEIRRVISSKRDYEFLL